MTRKLPGAARRNAALFAALLLSLSLPAEAHHAASGQEGAGQLPHGGISLNLDTDYVRAERFSDAALISLAGRHIHAHSSDYVSTTVLSLGYGVTDDFTVGLSLPHVYRENIRAGHHSHSGGVTTNSVDDHGDLGGRGDITLRGQRRFLHRALSGIDLAVVFGLKVPSGETNATSDGETLETEFQGGSGSWDPLGGFVLAAPLGKNLTLGVTAQYTITTEGAQATDLGDHAEGGIGLTWREGGELHEHRTGSGGHMVHRHAAWDYGLKLDGVWTARQKEAGRIDPNSGGNALFLSPGIRYTSEHGWSARAGAGVPLVQNLRAGHADDRFRLSAGMGWEF